MRFVEETGGSWTAEQLRAAEAEIEQQKREWEANRLAAIKKEEEEVKRAADEDEMITYSREDAQNQVNNKTKFSKRNPVNRRLLKVKQSDQHGIVKRKGGRGRPPKHLIRNVVAQKPTTTTTSSLGTRRALRNSSTAKQRPPISRLAQSNSPTKRKLDGRQASNATTTTATAVKRNVSARLSSRLNKHAERSNDEHANVSSDDDQPLINPNRNNGHTISSSSSGGGSGSSNAKVAKIDSNEVTGGEQSENSEQRQSEDFDDSECSLDVMVDSTDPQESDEDDDGSGVEDNNENESTLVQSDDGDSAMSGDETDTDVNTKEKNTSLNSTLKNSSSAQTNHQIDINSPRSTRSHGRIKINLWTLDENQKLPELCAKRGHHKSGGERSKNNSSNAIDNANNDELNETCENGNGSSVEDGNDDAAGDDDNNSTLNEDYDSSSNSKVSATNTIDTKTTGTGTPDTKPATNTNTITTTTTNTTMRQSKISECFGKSASKVSGKSTPTDDTSDVNRTARKSIKVEKSNPASTTTTTTTSTTTTTNTTPTVDRTPTPTLNSSSNAKNHNNSIDVLINHRTPKVILNKHDVEMQQQKARLKTKT